MLVANAVAGVCFMLVHTPASSMATVSKAEYATFGALLDSLLLLDLILHIHSMHGVELASSDVTPANFRNIAALAQLVVRRSVRQRSL